MCSQFTQRTDHHALMGLLNILKEIGLFTDAYPVVLPYTLATVISHVDHERACVQMQFSLVPRWSKEPRVKFATHNARLETVDEKPTFKDAFVKRHCVVPMNGFVEPIYTGELAGNMVEFSPPPSHMLFAAAIWEEWISKSSGEIIQSFSVLTHDPLPFVAQTGHDRSPIFLDAQQMDLWLGTEGETPTRLKQILLENRAQPTLSAGIQRPMRPGWEKRIKK